MFQKNAERKIQKTPSILSKNHTNLPFQSPKIPLKTATAELRITDLENQRDQLIKKIDSDQIPFREVISSGDQKKISEFNAVIQKNRARLVELEAKVFQAKSGTKEVSAGSKDREKVFCFEEVSRASYAIRDGQLVLLKNSDFSKPAQEDIITFVDAGRNGSLGEGDTIIVCRNGKNYGVSVSDLYSPNFEGLSQQQIEELNENINVVRNALRHVGIEEIEPGTDISKVEQYMQEYRKYGIEKEDLNFKTNLSNKANAIKHETPIGFVFGLRKIETESLRNKAMELKNKDGIIPYTKGILYKTLLSNALDYLKNYTDYQQIDLDLKSASILFEEIDALQKKCPSLLRDPISDEIRKFQKNFYEQKIQDISKILKSDDPSEIKHAVLQVETIADTTSLYPQTTPDLLNPFRVYLPDFMPPAALQKLDELKHDAIRVYLGKVRQVIGSDIDLAAERLNTVKKIYESLTSPNDELKTQLEDMEIKVRTEISVK